MLQAGQRHLNHGFAHLAIGTQHQKQSQHHRQAHGVLAEGAAEEMEAAGDSYAAAA